MRVLVTGAGGQVGGAVSRLLAGRAEVAAHGRATLDLENCIDLSCGFIVRCIGVAIDDHVCARFTKHHFVFVYQTRLTRCAPVLIHKANGLLVF